MDGEAVCVVSPSNRRALSLLIVLRSRNSLLAALLYLKLMVRLFVPFYVGRNHIVKYKIAVLEMLSIKLPISDR
uniref:Ovule protein n=1 Tax=Heterorhabditis bacteriophora TaxID=37862 RepID=A0A1I7X9J5_HETBA